MDTKVFVAIIVVVVVIGGGLWYAQTGTVAPVTVEESQELDNAAAGTVLEGSDMEVDAADVPVQKVAGYTLAQVAEHATAASCWSAVNGSVYDLTKWIPLHPGGEAKIKAICGKDGSAAFTGKHGGQEKPEATLATFKIGTLAE